MSNQKCFEPMDFAKICELEPRIKSLFAEARSIEDDGTCDFFCANEIYYGTHRFEGRGFKDRISALVGWYRESDSFPQLRSSAAYICVVKAIYDALPSCRGECGCMYV